jgi:serine/threonine protein kinase
MRVAGKSLSGEPGWALPGLEPGQLVAGYRVESRIGTGGMAMVWRARDEALGRTVALKILPPALAENQKFRERFTRESRAVAAVDHPHIIPVYAAGESGGVLYLAMRFVGGGDLRSLARREGPLPGHRAVTLLSPIAAALDAAHTAGLVHRDVKPANILVDTGPDRPEHPYLSDFGLAKGNASSAGLTGAGQFLGTPDFAAPEQIAGRKVTPRTDQYALACVAYTVLTGKLPFARSESLAVLWAQMYDPPPSIARYRRDLPAAVDTVLARALAKVPRERYASCLEFIGALRAALSTASAAGHAGDSFQVCTAQSPGTPSAEAPRPPAAGPNGTPSPRRQATQPFRRPVADGGAGRQPNRRRRRLLAGALAAGCAAAVAVILIAVTSVPSSPTAPTPPRVAATRRPASAPSPTPSRYSSASPTAAGSLVSDREAGLTYGLLPAPWERASCPASLNKTAFTWTAGEHAVAGQISNGTTWYGEACSGPLPKSYGYSGPAQLQTVAEKLARTFSGAYYKALRHIVTSELDQTVSVSGHDAWEITWDISYTDAAAQGASWIDEQAAVLVVDTGAKQEPAVFFTSVPQNLNENNINILISSLRLL